MFTPVPMTFFRYGGRQGNYYLVSTQGFFPVQRKSVPDRSKRERRSFNSTTTDNYYVLGQKFTCRDKCLVCLEKYKVSLKQYVGQTGEKF